MHTYIQYIRHLTDLHDLSQPNWDTQLTIRCGSSLFWFINNLFLILIWFCLLTKSSPQISDGIQSWINLFNIVSLWRDTEQFEELPNRLIILKYQLSPLAIIFIFIWISLLTKSTLQISNGIQSWINLFNIMSLWRVTEQFKEFPNRLIILKYQLFPLTILFHLHLNFSFY